MSSILIYSLFNSLSVVAFFPFFRWFSPVFCPAARARVFACFALFFVFMQNNFCIFCICKICICILRLCKIVQNLHLHNRRLLTFWRYAVPNDNEWKRKKRKLRNITKKRKMLLNTHVIVIFYAKTVYFFIHLKNVFIAFFLIFVHFPFFSLISFLFVICELRFFY